MVDKNGKISLENMTDYDLLLLIDDVEKNGMIKAPDRLKENIIAESQKINNQAIRQANNVSAKVELWLYGFKTAVAVTVAIILFSFINKPSMRYEIFNRYEINYEDQENNYSDYEEKRTFLGNAMDKMDEKLGQITDRFSGNKY